MTARDDDRRLIDTESRAEAMTIGTSPLDEKITHLVAQDPRLDELIAAGGGIVAALTSEGVNALAYHDSIASLSESIDDLAVVLAERSPASLAGMFLEDVKAEDMTIDATLASIAQDERAGHSLAQLASMSGDQLVELGYLYAEDLPVAAYLGRMGEDRNAVVAAALRAEEKRVISASAYPHELPAVPRVVTPALIEAVAEKLAPVLVEAVERYLDRLLSKEEN